MCNIKISAYICPCVVVSTVVGLVWALVTTLAGEALLWTVEEFSDKDEADGA